jgi:transcription elongation GreA/GreB family factor
VEVPFLDEAKSLLASKSYEDLEARWMRELESKELAAGDFLQIAKGLRQADERPRADSLLELLADALKEKKAHRERLVVLKELARLSKKAQNFRPAIEESLRAVYGNRSTFDKVLKFVKFHDPAANPGERAEKVENWMMFEEGEVFFMPGRGAGVVVELNPELGVCRLDFEKEKRISVPLGAAPKYLTPLPAGHELRRKIEDAEAFRVDAAKKPAETFARILQSFGRPMGAGEVKDALIGVVPETKWSSWWTTARKHPQIVVSGTGAKATYGWNASAADADQAIRTRFQKASLRDKLDLARKHSARSAQLASEFAKAIALEAERASRSDPSLAWEAFATIERLGTPYEKTFDPNSILAGAMAGRVVSQISDRNLREKAIRDIRAIHPDPRKVYGELFFMEEEPKMIQLIADILDEIGANDIRDRLLDETLRYPKRHPRAYFWLLTQLDKGETLSDRASFALLQQMLDALTMEEFAPVRARIRDFFDKGGLAVRIVMQQMSEEQGRKLLDTLERYGALEEYRRENVRAAALMRYPSLREPQVEPIYATAEMLKAKREEFERLKTVEIPANLKAIQEAREMGDLRENFEYKAARQRQEYLSARISELNSELSRVRLLDPNEVDTSEVRIGTKVVLSNGDVRREVTILGPWESSPEHGVYSNQSEVAKAMLGKKQSEIVSFMGNDYAIESIQRWQ